MKIDSQFTAGDAAVSLPAFPDAIVLQFGHKVVRGYTDRAAWSPEVLQKNALESPEFIPLDSTEPETVLLKDIKAAFFVRTFEGSGDDPIHFHGNASPKPLLWVKVVFLDGEEMEGMMANSRDLLLYDTISLVLSDPENNNLLAVFTKSQIREFHVLGIRS